jgi:hypothetical protein
VVLDGDEDYLQPIIPVLLMLSNIRGLFHVTRTYSVIFIWIKNKYILLDVDICLQEKSGL